MPSYASIDEATQAAILKFVDSVVPGPCDDIWLGGSRANGSAQADSAYDVVAFSSQAPAEDEDLFAFSKTKEVAAGVKVALIVAHPRHWGDPGDYMKDLRRHGFRLR
jgi:hypothetical protein